MSYLRLAAGSGTTLVDQLRPASRLAMPMFAVPFTRREERNEFRRRAVESQSVVEPKLEAGDTVYDHAHAAFFHSLHSSSYDGRSSYVVATGRGEVMPSARRVRPTMIAPTNKTAVTYDKASKKGSWKNRLSKTVSMNSSIVRTSLLWLFASPIEAWTSTRSEVPATVRPLGRITKVAATSNRRSCKRSAYSK